MLAALASATLPQHLTMQRLKQTAFFRSRRSGKLMLAVVLAAA